MWKRLKKQILRWRGIEITAITVTLAVITVQLTGGFQFIECAILDQWFLLRPIDTTESRVVIVTIDEKDLSQLGRWPISDATLAKLLNKIKLQQPAAIGLDLYRNLPVEPGNQELLDVYAATPNLIGIKKALSNANEPLVEAPAILSERDQVAACDLVLESDGKIRRYLLSVRVKPRNRQNSDEAETSLTLGAKLALTYLEARNIIPESVGSDGALKLGKAKFVPLQENEGGYVRADVGGYQILANFYKSNQGVKKISITDVLENRIPANLLAGKIVLIGSIAESLSDRFYTPISKDVTSTWTGVELHADLTNQIVSAALGNRKLLRGVPEYLGWLWILLWSTVGATLGWEFNSRRISLVKSPPVRMPAGSLLRWAIVFLPGAMFCLAGSTYLLFVSGWWITLVSPLLALFSAGLLSRVYLLWRGLQLSHQALANYAQMLEIDVRERTQELLEKNIALERAKQEAESANIAKSTFLANISHELRTPLNAILGFSQILAHDKDLNGEQQKHIEIINRSGKHLLELINDVLSMSKIEAGRTVLVEKTFDLYEFISSIQQMLQLRATAKGLDLKFELAKDIPQYIHCDESKLRQVLINLLGNAIKFTPVGNVILSLKIEAIDEANLDRQKQNIQLGTFPEVTTSLTSLSTFSQNLLQFVNQETFLTKGRLSVTKNQLLNIFNISSFLKAQDNFLSASYQKIPFYQKDPLTQISSNALSSSQSISKQNLHRLVFEIRDTGLGIAPEEVEILFNPFVQTTIGQQSMEGTGLGLAISREYVRLMGGDIKVSSAVNQGSTFSFDIQFRIADKNEVDRAILNQRIAGLANNQPCYRILVVEDVSENRLLLVKLLEPIGFEIREARNGKEAVEIWKNWQPHLIFMDIRMPVMDGYEATKRIRKLEKKNYSNSSNHQGNDILFDKYPTTIIALSASTFEEQKEKLYKAGCDDFIGKPFNQTSLYDKIARYLNIEYIYESEQQAVNVTAERNNICILNIEMLSAMPEEWISKLHFAAQSLNDQLVTELISQIPEESSSLTYCLEDLVDSFRLDIILDCVNEYLNKFG